MKTNYKKIIKINTIKNIKSNIDINKIYSLTLDENEEKDNIFNNK